MKDNKMTALTFFKALAVGLIIVTVMILADIAGRVFF
jgi:hypothetical protein